jgi:hypothetical protein
MLDARPAPAAVAHFPYINDVTNEIQAITLYVVKEIDKKIHFGILCAEVDIGNKYTAVGEHESKLLCGILTISLLQDDFGMAKR